MATENPKFFLKFTKHWPCKPSILNSLNSLPEEQFNSEPLDHSEDYFFDG